MHVLLQYQSKSYYIIGQEVYYSIGRFITLSGSYYIIGRFLLQYRAFITLSVGTRGRSSGTDARRGSGSETNSNTQDTMRQVYHWCNTGVTE